MGDGLDNGLIAEAEPPASGVVSRSATRASPPPSVIAALRASAVLHLLPAATLDRLAALGGSMNLARGEILCQQGEPGDAVYIVLQGEIEVLLRAPDGHEVRVAALGPGSLVGDMAVLDGGPRSADMQATRPCLLWRIPRAALIETLEADPKTAIVLLSELSRRLRSANEALDASARLDLGGRLARLLLKERGAKGLVTLTQTEMARRVGASREKVNRKLHAWASEGRVDITPAGVRLLQGGLDDLANPFPSAQA